MTNDPWVTADTHYFHHNIIKYCKRPFKSVEKMNNVLIDNHNDTVKKEDDIFIIGDFIWGNDKSRASSIVSRLNGNIHLILGNHDNMKPFDYVNAGVKSVHTSLELEKNLYLAHDPAVRCTLPDNAVLICGHVHGLFKFLIDKKVANCGVDIWDFKPIKLSELLSKAVGYEVREEKENVN